MNEETGENPWDIRFFTMFHMTNDSHLFHTQEDLEAQGFALEGHRFVRGDEVYLPLYEAKMFHHYDHRYGTFGGVDSRSDVHLPNPTIEQYQDAAFIVQPWYWVDQKEVNERYSFDQEWQIVFRNVRVTDVRTGVFSIIPHAGLGNSAPILNISPHFRPSKSCNLIANMISFVFDFAIRQKVGGINFNFYIVKQLPVLPSDRYTPDLLDFIVPRVVELSYTAWDLQPFARDVLAEVGPERWARWFADAPVHAGPPPPWAAAPSPSQGEGRGEGPAPFVWDEDRRAVLRAELDALYAHLYGLTRDELAYILDTFPIVKRKDEAAYGEYRTKRMVLEAFETLRPLTE